tara:strand:+ start:538 stop:663 length:126 start_codon:yes stop_codon:yes gene_type:complete
MNNKQNSIGITNELPEITKKKSVNRKSSDEVRVIESEGRND